MRLVDRRAESEMLDGLVESVRGGQSRALVLSGEAGVGTTALLQFLTGRAAQCRVVQIVKKETCTFESCNHRVRENNAA